MFTKELFQKLKTSMAGGLCDLLYKFFFFFKELTF